MPTFKLQRFYPEAHRFQEDETKPLLRAARVLHCAKDQFELLKFKRSHTREIRKWLHGNGGHSTWRQQVALLEALKGKRPSATQTSVPPLKDEHALPAVLFQEKAAELMEAGRLGDIYENTSSRTPLMTKISGH